MHKVSREEQTKKVIATEQAELGNYKRGEGRKLAFYCTPFYI